jgi:tRNA nucleotidyltransferase/poly(A) polymerase
MVPKWENLEKLIKYYKYLQEKLKTDNFFLVGGCIRDLLLNINDNIEDIDLTMP